MMTHADDKGSSAHIYPTRLLSWSRYLHFPMLVIFSQTKIKSLLFKKMIVNVHSAIYFCPDYNEF